MPTTPKKTPTKRPRKAKARPNYAHAATDGRHEQASCPACLARVTLRDQVNELMYGHPVDNLVLLADFVTFVVLEVLTVEHGDTLDDQKLCLPMLGSLAKRVNDGILTIQDDVRRTESLRAIGPTRPQ